MEYERIHEVQTGIISPSKLSPSKLRMKLMGRHNRRKDGASSNSSRTSPSRLEDNELVKNGLLASKSGDIDEEVAAAPGMEVTPLNVLSDSVLEPRQGDQTSSQPKGTFAKENGDMGCTKMQKFAKVESGNSSAIHQLRAMEDENLDYDSNASSSSFEFHRERSLHNQFTRSFSRPMPSKWNDAEKWIMSRQNFQPNCSKKNTLYNQANRMLATNMVRVAPESTNYDPKSSISRMADTKRVDFCQPASQMAFDKFSFTSPGSTHSVSHQPCWEHTLIDPCAQNKDLNEVDKKELSCTKSSTEDATDVPVIRSVCMRDMGTEMTPVTSQEPSRTATPVGSTTPLRSPTSSIPSTPRRGALAPTPMEHTTGDTQPTTESGKKELTELELKEKTRREIVALGVQLGKMNIAAWANKGGHEKNKSSTDMEEPERLEFETRAAAWEEAEKSKHAARFKREEIKIQAWESQQKAKLEAEMRRIEAQVEKMRIEAQAKMAKKISMAGQRSEEKRAAAEARKKRDAERTAAQAEFIRQTGRIPSSQYICCGWLV